MTIGIRRPLGMDFGTPRRCLRGVLVGATAAALGSCTLHYEVDATAHGDAVTFAVADRSQRSCVDSFEIRSRDSKTVMWRLTKRSGSTDCAASFPLQYGVAPAGLVQEFAATKLDPETPYEIEGTGGGAYSGAFKLLRSGEALNRWTEY